MIYGVLVISLKTEERANSICVCHDSKRNAREGV